MSREALHSQATETSSPECDKRWIRAHGDQDCPIYIKPLASRPGCFLCLNLKFILWLGPLYLFQCKRNKPLLSALTTAHLFNWNTRVNTAFPVRAAGDWAFALKLWFQLYV